MWLFAFLPPVILDPSPHYCICGPKWFLAWLCVPYKSAHFIIAAPASKEQIKQPPGVCCAAFHASLSSVYVHILALFREQIMWGIGMARRLCANAKPIFHFFIWPTVESVRAAAH